MYSFTYSSKSVVFRCSLADLGKSRLLGSWSSGPAYDAKPVSASFRLGGLRFQRVGSEFQGLRREVQTLGFRVPGLSAACWIKKAA